MANSKHANSRLKMETAEALQASLYNAANQALKKAIDEDNVTPALLSSIHKMLADAGVQPSMREESPLWSLAESLESLSYLNDRTPPHS